MSRAPEQFLDRTLLRRLAGEDSFVGGERCFALGGVRQMDSGGSRVSAEVTGSRTYRVKLWRRGGKLLFRCDCEAGRDEAFCQHCVAVGLAWLSRSEEAVEPTAESSESKADRGAIRDGERRQIKSHLTAIHKDRLESLLLEATDYDEILRRRLLLEAIGISHQGKNPRRGAARRRNGLDLAAYRRLLREAITPTGYVDYHAMQDYAQGLEEAIRPLAGLLREGWYEPVVELAEFILCELDLASDRVDTGDALLNKVYDELQRCHFEACRAAPLDTRELASRLLHYELEGGLGAFNQAVRTYADILGPAGLSAWRTLLIREWQMQTRDLGLAGRPAGVPTLIDHRRFQTQLLMERLAASEGDAQALFAVKSSDLTGARDVVAWAEWLQGQGRDEEAIARAEQAAVRFPQVQDRAVLRDFLVSAYQKAQRDEQALPLAWQQFSESFDLEHFRELKAIASRLGKEHWPAWRERAFSLARGQARERSDDQSHLVELMLDENLIGAAWDAAGEGGCRDDLWLVLAGRRESEHPRDALRIYQRKIGSLLASGAQHGYREVLGWLHRVRELTVRLDAPREYAEYVACLRSAHRSKRALVRLLDADAT